MRTLASGRTGADGEERLVRLVLWTSFGGARGRVVMGDAAVRENGSDEMGDSCAELPPLEAIPPIETEPEPERRAVDVRVLDEAGRPIPSAWGVPEGPLLEGTALHLGRPTDASGRFVLPDALRIPTWLLAGRGTRQERISIGPTQDRVDVTLREGEAPPRPDIRGIVTRVEGEVRISVGRNARVTPDLVFGVWRFQQGESEPRWIETLLVDRVEETWAACRTVPGPGAEGPPPRIGDPVCTNP